MAEAATKMETRDVKVIMEARVREVLGPNVKMAGTAIEALNDKVIALIEEAGRRCKENGRVTVQAQDF